MTHARQDNSPSRSNQEHSSASDAPLSAPGGVARLLLGLALLLSVSAQGVSEPLFKGQDISCAVQCDGLSEIYSPLTSAYLALYGRYRVEPSRQHVDIIWCEPHWNDPAFPCYPVSLVVDSGADAFVASNSIRGRSWREAKPTGEREILSLAPKDYQIPDLRFAERDAEATAILVDDFSGLDLSMDGEHKVSITDSTRSVAAAKVTVANGKVTRMEVLDKAGKCAKALEYVYGPSSDGAAQIQEVLVTIPETCLPAKANPGEVVVTIDNVPQELRDFAISYHVGGRTCRVKYDDVILGALHTRFPVSIEVRNAATHQFLRSVSLSGFACAEPEVSSDPGGRVLTAFPFDADAMRWRDFEQKYWLMKSDEITEDDRQELLKLRETFLRGLDNDGPEGLHLRHLHFVCIIELLLDDEASLLAHLEEYADHFLKRSQERLVLFWGDDFFHLAVRWPKPSLADKFLVNWKAQMVRRVEPEYLLWFCEQKVPYEGWLQRELLHEIEKESLTKEQHFLCMYLLTAATGRLLGECNAPDPNEVVARGLYDPRLYSDRQQELRQEQGQARERALVLFRELGDSQSTFETYYRELTRTQRES